MGKFFGHGSANGVVSLCWIYPRSMKEESSSIFMAGEKVQYIKISQANLEILKTEIRKKCRFQGSKKQGACFFYLKTQKFGSVPINLMLLRHVIIIFYIYRMIQNLSKIF